MNRRSKLHQRTDGPGVRTWVGTRKARESTADRADGADGGTGQRAHAEAWTRLARTGTIC